MRTDMGCGGRRRRAPPRIRLQSRLRSRALSRSLAAPSGGEALAFLAEAADGSGRLMHVLAIFENKSVPDRQLLARLREYAAMFSLCYAREYPDLPLPAIVLLVPYTGARRRDPLRDAGGKGAPPAPWTPYVVQLPFRLVDIPRMDPKEFPQGDAALRGMLTAQALGARVRREFRGMEEEFAAVFRLLPSGGEEERATIQYIVKHAAECDRAELRILLRRALAQTGPQGREDNVDSVYDALIAEGEAKGLAKGKAEGKAEFLERQMSRRFGSLSDAHRAQIRAATLEQLDAWADEVLDADRAGRRLREEGRAAAR